MFLTRKAQMVAPEQVLPGRTERTFALAEKHRVLDAPLVTDEIPDGYEVAFFGLGCFWGAEEIYWQVPGVWSTSVGYAGGTTPNPDVNDAPARAGAKITNPFPPLTPVPTRTEVKCSFPSGNAGYPLTPGNVFVATTALLRSVNTT